MVQFFMFRASKILHYIFLNANSIQYDIAFIYIYIFFFSNIWGIKF
jgi:hypothetical protein